MPSPSNCKYSDILGFSSRRILVIFLYDSKFDCERTAPIGIDLSGSTASSADCDHSDQAYHMFFVVLIDSPTSATESLHELVIFTLKYKTNLH